jgi:hypothetical protein
MTAGVESPLGELVALVRSMVAEVDVGQFDALEAARVVEECAEAERLFAALRVLVASTLEDKAVWRREGFPSLAAWMASKTGTTVGSAKASLEMAGLLQGLPALAAAFRDGLLSEVQAREIADVASAVPGAEGQLIEAAAKLTLKGLQEECQRVEAASLLDEDERHRRVHKQRRTRAWVRKGAGHFSAVMTVDELGRLMAVLDAATNDIVVGALQGGWFESREAHSVDALMELLLPDSSVAAGPGTMLHVVVDYDALRRGHTVAGEICEIPGLGPIPVSLAAQMADDAILKVLLTKGVDVMAVAHGGPTVPAHLRSALEVRDPKCIVPGCNTRRGLQIDHRNTYHRTDHQTGRPGAPLPLPPSAEDPLRIYVSGRSGNLAVDTAGEPRHRSRQLPTCHHRRQAVLSPGSGRMALWIGNASPGRCRRGSALWLRRGNGSARPFGGQAFVSRKRGTDGAEVAMVFVAARVVSSRPISAEASTSAASAAAIRSSVAAARAARAAGSAP